MGVTEVKSREDPRKKVSRKNLRIHQWISEVFGVHVLHVALGQQKGKEGFSGFFFVLFWGFLVGFFGCFFLLFCFLGYSFWLNEFRAFLHLRIAKAFEPQVF